MSVSLNSRVRWTPADQSVECFLKPSCALSLISHLPWQELRHTGNVKSYTSSIYHIIYLLVVVVAIVVFLSISVSPAPCLQPRRTGRGCSQALLALLSNGPIRSSRGDHHSLPLLCYFRALHHHPLHLPAKVRHTGRSWPHQLSVNTRWVMSHSHQQDAASELEKYFLVARNSQFNVTAGQF